MRLDRYLVVVAGSGACTYHAPESDPVDAAPLVTTLFVADYTAGNLHRFTLTPDDPAPVPSLTLVLPGALSPVIVPATGELLIGELVNPQIDRFATPFGRPAPAGVITGLGLAPSISKMVMVDDELVAVNPSLSNVDRLEFDPQGAAAMVDAFTVSNGRGILFDAKRRRLYVTQCCSTDTVLIFNVGPDGSVTPVQSLSGGLANPHGMLLTPWDELFVSNAGTSTISRFTFDDTGTPVPSALPAIAGNGLSVPIDLVLTPWGELYVTNLTNGTISRFTFDPLHAAIPRDNFPVASAMTLAWATLDVR